jgi:galactokinase
METFEALFGHPPSAIASAPGRVNLLGEHTDYNQGLVLPLAIPRKVHVELAPGDDGVHRFHSVQLDEIVAYRDGDDAPAGFARYVHGCIEVLRGAGFPVPVVHARIDSDVPIGAGLSSSAALEVAVIRALRSLLQLDFDDEAVARYAHEAETVYAGVRCGILDQMACSLASTDRMLFLDTRSLERRLVPLPEGTALLIIDSGVSRSLSASGYNQRRAECERAAAMLGVASLREVSFPPEGLLPAPLDRRVRHVLTENQRVRAALNTPSAADFGALMNASHASLSAQYEVSTPELDELAALLQRHRDVFGAKLTGAGFGGACVALVRQGASRAIAAGTMESFGAAHAGASVLLTE